MPLIDLAANKDNLQKLCLSDYAKSIRYVTLESPPGSPLRSGVLKAFSDKYILCSDMELCYLFDADGKYIRQIGKKGRGPAEYTGISYVDIINDKIFIHDYYTDDLLEYDTGGVFIDRYKSGFSASDMNTFGTAIMLNDSMIFGNINRTGADDNRALIINKYGVTFKSYKNYNAFRLNPNHTYVDYAEDAIVSRYKGTIIFKDDFNDTVFRMDNHYQLLPDFVLNLGKYQEPLSERRIIKPPQGMNSYITVKKVFQTDNLILIVCDFAIYFPARRLTPRVMNLPGVFENRINWYNTGYVLGVYDKRLGSFAFSEPTSTDNFLFTSGLYNNIDAGPRFIPDYIINDSTLVMDIRFFEHLVQHIESPEFKRDVPIFPEKKKWLGEFVDSLKMAEIGNNILMIITLKK
jgi:hypothetical protein